MQPAVTVRCTTCGHQAVLWLPTRTPSLFRCTLCDGIGKVTATAPAMACRDCAAPIPEARLRAIPGTRLCVTCAAADPSGAADRHVIESWGSREDWARDRASWQRSHPVL